MKTKRKDAQSRLGLTHPTSGRHAASLSLTLPTIACWSLGYL